METEAKIRVPSVLEVKRKIRAAGGRLLNPRTFEANTLFDGEGGEIRATGRSFRVRRYGAKGSVTLKGVATVRDGVKSREELETRVGSPEVLAEILHALGFVSHFRYEKFREVWKVGPAVVCLDETPLGHFVEIEAAKAVIPRVAKSLGLDAADFLGDSYPALWCEAGRRGDMVFSAASRAAEARDAPVSRSRSRG